MRDTMLALWERYVQTVETGDEQLREAIHNEGSRTTTSETCLFQSGAYMSKARALGLSERNSI